MLSSFGADLGLDPGTANTVVYAQGRGIVVQEPSGVALSGGRRRVLAVGREAQRMVGRTPRNITTVRPVRAGAVADLEVAHSMMRSFLGAACSLRGWIRPHLVMAVSVGATEVERRAVRDVALRAGARSTLLVEEPLAAAIGAGLPIEDPYGCMIVDIGGGTTEVAVTSLGGVVARTALRVAGDDMDEAIMEHVRWNHGLIIGQPTAEALKIQLGTMRPVAGDKTALYGRDMVSGLPRELEITAAEVRAAISGPLEQILAAVEMTLSTTPPELAADVMDRGILLTGGVAQLPGLDVAVAERTRVSAYLAEQPQLAVARGVGRLVEEQALRGRLLAPPPPRVVLTTSSFHHARFMDPIRGMGTALSNRPTVYRVLAEGTRSEA
jgi:rod shape-determining protein MreB